MPSLSHFGKINLAITWTVTSLGFFSISICLVRSIFILRKFHLSDGSNTLAFVVGIVLVSQSTWATVLEDGKDHQMEFSDDKIQILAKSLLINEALWTLANALLRVSAGLLFHKLFAFGKTRILTMALVGLSLTHGIASVIEVLLICRPLSAQWDSEARGACGNQILSFIIVECVGIALDIALLGIPLYSILKLDLSMKKKAPIIIALDAGVVLLSIAAWRLHSLHLATSPDFIYSKSLTGILSAVGVMLGVTFCSLPFFLALYNRRSRTPRQDAEAVVFSGGKNQTATDKTTDNMTDKTTDLNNATEHPPPSSNPDTTPHTLYESTNDHEELSENYSPPISCKSSSEISDDDLHAPTRHSQALQAASIPPSQPNPQQPTHSPLES